MKRIFLIIFYLVFALRGFCQSDTLQPRNNNPEKPDTQRVPEIAKPPAPKRVINLPVQNKPTIVDSTLPGVASDSGITLLTTPIDTILHTDTKIKNPVFTGIDSVYARFLNNPFLPIDKKPVFQIVKLRKVGGKDELFYIIASLIFFLACIKWIFSKYYSSIFRFFVQPSFKQKQTREQLMQSSLPSFLFNIFFIVSGATYVSLLLGYFNLFSESFVQRFLYSTIGLLLLYIGKYILLSFSGWVFNVKEAAGTYIFSVNLINKILGVFLVPFIMILAFSKASMVQPAITISYIVVILLFVYRYVVSYAPVRKEIKVGSLHFFIYVLSFEILPLLFIYKSLILYMNRTL